MADIITVADLPTALQSQDMVADMVAGANARAFRVAPCLVAPTAAWAATTAYALDDTVILTGGEALKVSTAGTSGATAPTAPTLAATVADGTVTWTRISPTPAQLAEAKLVLLGAVKRWLEAGSGELSSQQAGPFGMTVDTRQRTGYNFRISEVGDLRAICATGGTGREAFSIDTAPAHSGHLPWCSINFGATYCSCGVDIASAPIFELG